MFTNDEVDIFRLSETSQQLVSLKMHSSIIKNYSAYNQMSSLLSSNGITSEGRKIGQQIDDALSQNPSSSRPNNTKDLSPSTSMSHLSLTASTDTPCFAFHHGHQSFSSLVERCSKSEDSAVLLMDFKGYCHSRKARQALKAGVALSLEDARSKSVVCDRKQSLFYTRNEKFADKTIDQCKTMSFKPGVYQTSIFIPNGHCIKAMLEKSQFSNFRKI